MDELKLLDCKIRHVEQMFTIIVKDLNDRLNRIEDKLREYEEVRK